MISNLINTFYIFLYIAPFAIIRYYPFRNKLRVSIKTLCIIYGVLIGVQSALFCYLSSQPYWNLTLTQVFRISFIFIYAGLSFTLVNEDIFKQFYVWTLMFTFGTIITTNANFIEAKFFPNFSIIYPHAVYNLVMFIHFVIFIPLIFKLTDKKIIPMIYSADSKVWRTVWLIPAFLYTGTFIATSSIEPDRVSSLSYLIIRHFNSLGVIFVSLILFETLNQTAQNARLSENILMTERQLALEKEHYKMLAEHIEDAKRARHDLRHHLSLIHSYLSDNDMENLKEYIEQYQLMLPTETAVSLCKNYTVNVIVNYYYEIAQQEGIDTDIQLKLPQKMDVADSDLCIVFGNLLENAIEACKRQRASARFMTISAGLAGNNLAITVDNSFEGNINLEGDIFLSSKRQGRGIGITSVQAVAQKYDGLAKFEYIENVFRASVMLQTIK